MTESDASDLSVYTPLYSAAFKGEIKAATDFFENNRTIFKDIAITGTGKTTLHIAAASGQTAFVKKFVEDMEDQMLEKTDNGGHTALYFAVVAGNLEAAKAMVEKNKQLPQIPNGEGVWPILEAARLGHRELLLYLFEKTADPTLSITQSSRNASPFRGKEGVMLLKAIIDANFYDIAIRLVKKVPEVATTKEDNQSALDVLARRSSSFKSGTELGFWERRFYSFIHIKCSVPEQGASGEDVENSHGADIRTPSNPELKFSGSSIRQDFVKIICWPVHCLEKQSRNQTSGEDLENAISTPRVPRAEQLSGKPVPSLRVKDTKHTNQTSQGNLMNQRSVFHVWLNPNSVQLRDMIRNFITSLRDVKLRTSALRFKQGIQNLLIIALWPTKPLVTFMKKVHDTKLLHHQAVELVKCICKEVERLHKYNDIMALVNLAFLDAAEFGIVEFMTVCLEKFPQLISIHIGNHTILHKCIIHRQEAVFKLLQNEWNACQNALAAYQDLEGNNILHLAAKLAPPEKRKAVSGAALQMQRDTQWYKAVEKITKPTYRELQNKDRDTPRALFVKEHELLVKSGEKWIRGLASSCSLVATLIATMVFAVAFTVPGGYNETGHTGIPVFLEKHVFILFALSDALALISSLTSVLIFLSILTSRCAEEDFMVSIPKKLIYGLATLFVSITAMALAFTSTYFIMFSKNFEWVPAVIAGLIGIPILVFALLQLPLFVEVYASTYGDYI